MCNFIRWKKNFYSTVKQVITLKHIARELNVSISTVSKALKNSEEISRDTKEKIQAYAKLYNYRPNNIAVSLKNKRTKNIGIVIPHIVHHFFTTLVRGVENYADSKGYNVIVCVSDEQFDKEVINMEMLAHGSIDGFILSLATETQLKNDYNHLKEITAQGIPLVLVDRVTDEIECDKVIINDREIAYTAVKKLIEDGRKKIALITTENYLSVGNQRTNGYLDALKESGMEVDENLILRLPEMKMDEKAIDDFFDREKVDAVLCVWELYAIYGMRVIQKKGMRIPDDVAFIGFTDGLLSKYANPSLTAIAQHGVKMGETAAEMLIEKIESEKEEETYRTEIIPSTLVERESTVN